jgi:hypothetical protein
MQDIELRLSVLKELQRFLVQFVEEMSVKTEEFNRRVAQLHEDGVAVQIADYYEANYGAPSLQQLRNLIANIIDVTLPHIKAAINQLEQNLIWRDTRGNIVARRRGDRILDNSENWLYEIRGNWIYDTSGNWRYELRGDRVYDTSGNWRYELRGDRIYDTAGNWLGYGC